MRNKLNARGFRSRPGKMAAVFVCVAAIALCADRPPEDVIFVLDNSASMQVNDPKHLVPEMVRQLAGKLIGEDRIGVVVFDSAATLVLPLSPAVDAASAGALDRALTRLDYTGRFTFSAEGVERANRELTEKSRSGALPVIVFLTDGLIDTGDAQRDRDKRAWLTGPLLDDMKGRGVRVFGVALGKQADFQLVQTLGQGTHTGYGEIEDVGQIGDRISQLENTLTSGVPSAAPARAVEPSPAARPPVVVVQGGVSAGTVALAIGVVLLVVCAAIWLARGRSAASPAAPLVAAKPAVKVPGACLLLPSGLGKGGETAVELSSRELWIGSNAEGTALCVPGDQISANHFRIEYDGASRAFNVIDNSANGTWLWKAAAVEGAQLVRLKREEPARLSEGDRIVLPGFGRDKAIEFHLTSKYAPDRPAGATRLTTAAAFLRVGRAGYPVLSFTSVGFSEGGALTVGPGTPTDARLLIERLSLGGEAGADSYRLSCQASGVSVNGAALENGFERELAHGDAISMLKDGKTFELLFDAPSQASEPHSSPAANEAAEAATDAVPPEAPGSGAPAEDAPVFAGAPRMEQPEAPKKTLFGRGVMSPQSSFSEVDASSLQSAEDPKTRVRGARVNCGVHTDQEATEICSACAAPVCPNCAKEVSGKVYCGGCAAKVA